MRRSLTRGAALALMGAGLVFLSAGGQLTAQHASPDTPLNDLADKMRGEGIGPDDTPKPAPDAKSPAPKAITLDDGTTRLDRPDGVVEFTRKDGMKQYVQGDYVLTVYPDGRKVLQKNGQVIGRADAPPSADDDLRRHRPKEPPPPPPAKPAEATPAPKEPLDIVNVPLPQSTGKHADWRQFEKDVEELRKNPILPAAQLPGPDGGKAPDTARLVVVDDPKVVPGSRLPSGIEVFPGKDGNTQYRLPDKTVVTRFPGISDVAVTGPDGKTKVVGPGADGFVKITAGGADVAFDPATGKAYAQTPEGRREIIRTDGSWGSSDGTGGVEVRGSRGELLGSMVNAPDSKYRVIQDGTGAYILDPEGNRVAKGVVVNGRMEYVDIATGEKVPVNEILPPAKIPDNAIGRQIKGGNFLPPPTGKYTPPKGPGFQRAKETYEKLKKAGKVGTPQFERAEAVVKSGEALKARGVDPDKLAEKSGDALDKARKLVDVAIRKADAELEVKRLVRAQDELRQKMEAELAKTRAQKAELQKQIDKAAGQRKDLGLGDLLFDTARNGIRQQRIVLNVSKADIEARDKMFSDDLATAMKRIDYSKYKDCPNKPPLPWDKCGHPDEKRKWLNAQLTDLLGKNWVAKLAQFKKDKEAYLAKVKELDAKEKELDQKEAARKAEAKKYDDQIASLKGDLARLTAGEATIQKGIDQAKARTDELNKRIADLAAEMTKYTDPPQ